MMYDLSQRQFESAVEFPRSANGKEAIVEQCTFVSPLESHVPARFHEGPELRPMRSPR